MILKTMLKDALWPVVIKSTLSSFLLVTPDESQTWAARMGWKIWRVTNLTTLTPYSNPFPFDSQPNTHDQPISLNPKSKGGSFKPEKITHDNCLDEIMNYWPSGFLSKISYRFPFIRLHSTFFFFYSRIWYQLERPVQLINPLVFSLWSSSWLVWVVRGLRQPPGPPTTCHKQWKCQFRDKCCFKTAVSFRKVLL